MSSVLCNSFCLSLLPYLYVNMDKLSKIISQFNHSSYVRMLNIWHLKVWLVKITCGQSELLKNCKLAFSKMIFHKNCWWKIKKQALCTADIEACAWVLIETCGWLQNINLVYVVVSYSRMTCLHVFLELSNLTVIPNKDCL